MKPSLSFTFSLCAFFVIITADTRAQAIFWSENFNNGCASNCLADGYNGWTILDNVDGTSGAESNNWYISCAEEGVVPPGCGSSCIGDASLHVGSNPGAGGDMGATFNETGIVNATYKMAVSPIINCTGKSSNTLFFDFIAFGSASCSDDRLQLRWSYDGGATWPPINHHCLTSVCCGTCNGYSQGQWTNYNFPLGALSDNNPNLRIAFHWRNNGNGSGTDPSAAIDDIRISTLTPLPVTLLNFNAVKENQKTKINWVSAAEIGLKQYELERAIEGVEFKKIYTKEATANQQAGNHAYQYTDAQSFPGAVFYRLKMLDLDGKFTYSKVVRVASPGMNEDLLVMNAETDKGKLNFSIWAGYPMATAMFLFDIQGRQLKQFPNTMLRPGINEINLSADASLANGTYILKVSSYKAGHLSLLNTTKKFVFTR